jgi:hypothetical protein
VLALGLALSVAGGGLALRPDQEPAPAVRGSLADRLEPRTWAFAIPQAWLAAPLGGLREGDVLDLIGTRASERATALEIARGLRVMDIGEAGLVVELTADDAAAIAEARARGLSFMPILRSSR